MAELERFVKDVASKCPGMIKLDAEYDLARYAYIGSQNVLVTTVGGVTALTDFKQGKCPQDL
ncbi:hypothetical protein Pmar_PMAR021969 [Perkinsus marinus ATCC 50983]|uniref:Uncharacterized protein n=1 Tax=Perkinsus marinus (strain ATCC 50983 / TXsc) TaxID=423536 RepID=C5LRN9_PERM5|nr:hypothetical protein Pmar_PMAR014166 [Perkinsus marinus ATCC 50983]XP_002767880.1 hypothetical protein Pmar_PMAR021969 [Perkinsus marinus ATCC 50983]EER00354.1 hypothetical protein Pmar_PMAR014166 [Perkinsus marinus ATCC 50983]EER00598.1 hypothetical protein Pmar_PMAR021969 [Perkinsus marinus ATCC 50983]|eukprot:XP_002767636.1 hypothetical protein Pmar_PMAR014166 [Perkinsus marinus ATCC 50983]